MENLYGSPLVANCLFIHNAAVSAGALHNSNASPLIVNCTFDANRANMKAGAIVNSGSTAATVVNSILWNSSPAAIYDEADSVTTVVYSNVQGGWSGEGNLSPSRIPRFSAVPSGMATAMSYDADACLTILTHTPAPHSLPRRSRAPSCGFRRTLARLRTSSSITMRKPSPCGVT